MGLIIGHEFQSGLRSISKSCWHALRNGILPICGLWKPTKIRIIIYVQTIIFVYCLFYNGSFMIFVRSMEIKSEKNAITLVFYVSISYQNTYYNLWFGMQLGRHILISPCYLLCILEFSFHHRNVTIRYSVDHYWLIFYYQYAEQISLLY
jgi:hypothetical protein